MTGGYDGMYRDHQVLVMTTGICFTKPELTQGRTVVILDEGSQVWVSPASTSHASKRAYVLDLQHADVDVCAWCGGSHRIWRVC
jgi:hypothetical protein